jgi:5-methylcytosine-specific restriction endonuclease McrA
MKKETLEEIVKTSKNKKECFSKLNFTTSASETHKYRIFNHYITLYNIDTSHFVIDYVNYVNRTRHSLEDIFNGKVPFYNATFLGKRLVKEGYLERKCSCCKLTEWMGKPIPLDLDHINGISTDHRLENLRLLCRNCHAQTDTFSGKNRKTKLTKTLIKEAKIANNKQIYIQKNLDKIEIVKKSNIDFSAFGWVNKIAPLIDMHHQKVNHWFKRWMPLFYEEKCFKRK